VKVSAQTGSLRRPVIDRVPGTALGSEANARVAFGRTGARALMECSAAIVSSVELDSNIVSAARSTLLILSAAFAWVCERFAAGLYAGPVIV